MPPWWGYSRDHGWVVIDRTITLNKSGLSRDILYFRCRDSTIFLDSRSRWRDPLFIYASTYLKALPDPESQVAAAEFAALKSRWEEFQAEIRVQFAAYEAQRQEQESARIRLEEERKGTKSKRKPKPKKVDALPESDLTAKDIQQ